MTDGIEALRVQLRWLANAIAATATLMFVSVAVPWLARMIEIDLAALAWTMTAFAAVHAGLTLAAERVTTRQAVARLLFITPLCGMAFLAALWHFGGGVAHPALALAMVIPVIAAGTLPRPAFAFDVAIYSIVAVALITVATSADFAWYLTQLGIPGVARLVPLAGDAHADPFPGATTAPAAMFLFVVTFAMLQLAVAFIATRVSRFLRLRDDVSRHTAAATVDALPAEALRRTPAAAVVVVADSGQIVGATKRFTQRMLLHNAAVIGGELFEFLAFDDAAAMRALLANGGVLPLCRYRVGSESRVAEVRASAFTHDGVRYASVVIEDETNEEEAAS